MGRSLVEGTVYSVTLAHPTITEAMMDWLTPEVLNAAIGLIAAIFGIKLGQVHTQNRISKSEKNNYDKKLGNG